MAVRGETIFSIEKNIFLWYAATINHNPQKLYRIQSYLCGTKLQVMVAGILAKKDIDL